MREDSFSIFLNFPSTLPYCFPAFLPVVLLLFFSFLFFSFLSFFLSFKNEYFHSCFSFHSIIYFNFFRLVYLSICMYVYLSISSGRHPTTGIRISALHIPLSVTLGSCASPRHIFRMDQGREESAFKDSCVYSVGTHEFPWESYEFFSPVTQ
ncbi:unnamed protein product [Acanthosepion pharaonis]|uniref:Uncharacterized protein n=1 Tax=Acanthosepion pharaonis TaxID=158019 RepID=A0A812AMF5_ACAPH|nr:unnamed protein product [Sepia pharaonis]